MRYRDGRILFLSMAVLTATILQHGCHSTEPVTADARFAQSSAIILVPGFKGTALARGDTGERVWITASEALFGHATLASNDSRLGVPAALELVPDGLLKRVRIVPGIFALDVYGSLSATLHERFQPGADIVEFAYDWRQDPVEAVKSLGALVSRLHARGVGSVSLVSHSFGGYITAYYLRYGVQDPEHAAETWEGAGHVDSVILMGTPFRGAMLKFRDMLAGETVGLNESLLDATAHSSFPSSYFLLPAPTEAPFKSARGEPLPISLYHPRSWRDHGWGLFAHDVAPPVQVNNGRLAFVSTHLDRAARVFRLVNAPPGQVPPSSLKVLSIVGRGRATLAQASMEDNRLDFTLFEDGDGVVTARSAELPEAYRRVADTSTTETTASHGSLWKDDEAEERIMHFLRAAQRRGKPQTSQDGHN
jgi:pimeloyl-ACP methyl ester carboxylesterase